MTRDRDYEKKIDALIPAAVKTAKAITKRIIEERCLAQSWEERPGKAAETYKHDFFTEFFHQEMGRLARDAGLRNV